MVLNAEQPTLVIGDIHHRTKLADVVLKKHAGRYNQIVFLGDYFDAYGDSPDLMRQTCHWLAGSIQLPNRIHLLGNHEVPYFLPAHSQAKCPGWTPEKQQLFEQERSNLPLESFNLTACLGPWFLSHAGIPEVHVLGRDSVALSNRIEAEFGRVRSGENSWIFDRGTARGGTAKIGSLLWQDWSREFRPVAGLNQIIGHTPARGAARGKCLTTAGVHRQFELMEPSPFPRLAKLPQPGGEWSSVNWCLDTEQIFSGLVERGELALVTDARAIS